MLDFLNQAWVGSVAGIVGAILAIIGLIALWKSRIGARPVVQITSRRLIGPVRQELPSEVQVRYENQPVPRLSSSRVVFWNAGNATITGDQVVQDDPVRLELADGEILEAVVVKPSREVIKFQVNKHSEPHVATISFDYLDGKKDGAVIDILHTSKSLNPEVRGTIRGVPSGIKRVGFTSFGARRDTHGRTGVLEELLGFMYGAFVFLLPLLLYSSLYALVVKPLFPLEEEPAFLGIPPYFSILALSLLSTMVLGFLITGARYPRSLRVDEREGAET